MKQLTTTLSLTTLVIAGMVLASAETSKRNILATWGDNIGVHNISAYNLGITGYHTPNIDRIAKEGALFADAYAGRAGIGPSGGCAKRWTTSFGAPQVEALVGCRRTVNERIPLMADGDSNATEV